MANKPDPIRLRARVEEIKRVWQPGMSAAKIAAAVDPSVFLVLNKAVGRPSRNAIIGMFVRHKELLEPCFLAAPHNTVPAKPKKVKVVAEPKPKLKPVPVKPLPKSILDKEYSLEASERQRRRYELDQRQLEREPFYKAQQAAKKEFTISIEKDKSGED